jgi:anthranilate phosphoribosyltransferase
MQTLLSTLSAGKSLSPAEVREAAVFLVDEHESAELKADFLRALAKKGETHEEIAAFVQEFLKLAVDPGLTSLTQQPPRAAPELSYCYHLILPRQHRCYHQNPMQPED